MSAPISARIVIGFGKSGLQHTIKSSNISETQKSSIKVTIEDQQEVRARFWLVPWTTLNGHYAVCFKTRAAPTVFSFIFSFTFNLLLVNK